jgi:hypothetical protein
MSGKKKGLSAEQKKEVILEIYHSHVRLLSDPSFHSHLPPQKEPFNLKEIEGLASKRGVVLQTVSCIKLSFLDLVLGEGE